MYIAVAFVLGILVCAMIMYVMYLKDTISKQQLMIQDLEEQLKELLSEKSNSDSIH